MNPAGVDQYVRTPDMTPDDAAAALERMHDELFEIKALLRGAPAANEKLLDRIAHCAHRISLAAEQRFLTIAKKAREVAWVADEIVIGYGGSSMAHLNRRVIILEDHLRRALYGATERCRQDRGIRPTV